MQGWTNATGVEEFWVFKQPGGVESVKNQNLVVFYKQENDSVFLIFVTNLLHFQRRIYINEWAVSVLKRRVRRVSLTLSVNSSEYRKKKNKDEHKEKESWEIKQLIRRVIVKLQNDSCVSTDGWSLLMSRRMNLIIILQMERVGRQCDTLMNGRHRLSSASHQDALFSPLGVHFNVPGLIQQLFDHWFTVHCLGKLTDDKHGNLCLFIFFLSFF